MPHDEQWEALCRGWQLKNSWRWDGTIEERETAEKAELDRRVAETGIRKRYDGTPFDSANYKDKP